MATRTSYKLGIDTITPAPTGAGGDLLLDNDKLLADLIEAAQADIAALDSAKAPLVHSHIISDVTGLQAALDSKASTTHAHSGADITSGTVADARLSSEAQAAIAARHAAVTIGTANGLSLSTQALSLATATTGAAGAMSAADKTKLDGVASGATANATDAQLRDRSTHTGTQAISTVTGLQSALDDKAPNAHDHEVVDIEGLQDALDGKLSLSGGTLTGDINMGGASLHISASNGVVGFGNGIELYSSDPNSTGSATHLCVNTPNFKFNSGGGVYVTGNSIYMNDGNGIGGGTLNADSGNIENVANLYVGSIYGASGTQNQLASYSGDNWILDYILDLNLTGTGSLVCRGTPIYMGNTDNTGGGAIYAEGGDFVGVSSLTFQGTGNVTLYGSQLHMNDGNGTGGGTIYMDRGDIADAGFITAKNGMAIHDAEAGLILVSDNATQYRVTVSNAGALVVTPV